jgi:hypothetical protein
VSAKDRWVDPREQVLNVPIAYWYMGPVSLVACRRQKLGLSLLLHWLAWERNWVRTRVSISRCAVDSVENTFSREQWDPSKSIGGSRKVAICGPHEIHMLMAIHGLSMESVWRVDRVFPYRVYIDSNHRDSRI